jgi:hypothetical protein
MVTPVRWKVRNAKLSKLAFVLLAAFPATLLVGFTAMYFEPPRFETRLFLSLDHPEREGQIIDSGISTLDTVVAVAVVWLPLVSSSALFCCSFRSTNVVRMPRRPSNQSLQPTAGRAGASPNFMKTLPFHSTLAPASGR